MSNLFFTKSKRRNGFQIMIDILTCLKEPKKKYTLMCMMRSTHPLIGKYLQLGQEYGLVQRKESTYSLTPKGRSLVEVLK